MLEPSGVSTRNVADLPEGFKMTELGPLPEEWRVVRLGDVVLKMKAGGTPKRTVNEYWGGQIPFALIEDITHSELYLYSTKRSITEAGLRNSNAWLVPPGSLLLTMYGTIGMTAINVVPLATNQAILAIIPSKDLDVTFAAYALRYHANRLAKENVQSTQKNISKQIVARFKVPLPPLSEQRAIAHLLRTVQRAKEATERVIAALKELKKSLMRHLFTYGPVPLDQADQVPLKETEIGPIPEHWKVVRLGEIADFKNGINFKREDRGRGILTIDVLNMYTDTIYPRLSGLYRVNITVRPDYLLAPGDLLFVRSSLKREGVGWTVIFPGHHEPVTFCGFLIRGRLHSKDILPEFIVNFLRLPSVRELMVSKSGKVAITNINQGNLKAIPIPVPPLDEQHEIARVLQTVDRKIEAEENRKQALDDLFKTLLHNLMTAKIRVPRTMVERFADHEPG